MKKEWWWALGAGAAAFGSAYWFLSRYPTEQRLRTEAEELLERGHRFVEDGDLTRALRVGERLLARRYTGGYELVARVFFERGRLAEAIEVLGKGVAQAPSVWVLWSQLGYCLSEDGRHEQALEAFERARSCDSEEMSIAVNEALVYLRTNEWEKALERAESVLADPESENLHPAAKLHRFSAMAMGGRSEEAMAEIESADLADTELANALAAVAYGHPDDDVTGALARRAYALDPTNPRVLLILRELRNERSPDTSLYRLDSPRRMTFVNAVDEEQARILLEELEGPLIEVEKITHIKAVPEQLIGLLEVFVRRDSDDVDEND